MSIVRIATEAGQRILPIYEGEIESTTKQDSSPLTEADRVSHEFITAELARFTPNNLIISEESTLGYDAVGASAREFWLVDPLDGTKEFLKKSGEFTVNIAFIADSTPVLGVVHCPVTGDTYYAERGQGAWWIKRDAAPVRLSVRVADPVKMSVIASRDHAGPKVSALLARLPGASLTNRGSSLKFCMVAAGQADLYLRDLPTMEWDTAAAQCVVEEAGGAVIDLEGHPLRYGKPGLRNPAILTLGDKNYPWRDKL